MITCPCCHDEPPWQLNGTADTRPDTRLAFMDSAACIRSHRGTGAMAGFSMEGQADGGGGVATCSAVGERAVRVREMTLSCPRLRIVHCTGVRGMRRGAWDG